MPDDPIPSSIAPYCPWCKQRYSPGDTLALAALKRHVKYCRQAPRPRGEIASKRAQKGCIEDLFGIAVKDREAVSAPTFDGDSTVTSEKKGEVMIPGTRAGLEQAGYHKSGASKCKRCGAPIEWYQTPNGKKMPFEDVETEMLPHFSRCGKNGSAPPRAQVPPAEGYYQRSGEGTLQEVSELLRMASLKIDALLAKEKF